MDNINNDNIYTFDQYNRLKGKNISVGYIETAMVIKPFNLCTNIEWKFDIYEADGQYIKECFEADGQYIKECFDNNIDNYVYIDEDLCYYNFLQ